MVKSRKWRRTEEMIPAERRKTGRGNKPGAKTV